jgi:hypothetical protein
VDRILNPYSPGAGSPPPALTGREAQEEQFRVLLGRLAAGRSEQSLVVSGLRGVGKTVLLGDFNRIALEEGWIAPDPLEIRPETEFRSAIARLTRDALRNMSRKTRAEDKLRSAVAVFKAFTIKLPEEYGGVEFGVDIDAAPGSADSGDLEYDLGALFQELGEVARINGTGVVFLVDEMQFLKKHDMEALCAAMHRMGQKLLPVGLAAAGLPQLPGLLVEAKSYAERLFAYPRLGKLTPDAARAALREPAEQVGAEYDDDALEHILAYTEGYPYFLQQYGKIVWDLAEASPIRSEDARAAEPIVQEKLDEEFFHVRFEKATPAERTYMSAMANLGDGPQGSGTIAEHMNRRVTSVSLTRGSLIKKGLIYAPATGLADFTVPHFADFMRRRYPYVPSPKDAPAR